MGYASFCVMVGQSALTVVAQSVGGAEYLAGVYRDARAYMTKAPHSSLTSSRVAFQCSLCTQANHCFDAAVAAPFTVASTMTASMGLFQLMKGPEREAYTTELIRASVPAPTVQPSPVATDKCEAGGHVSFGEHGRAFTGGGGLCVYAPTSQPMGVELHDVGNRPALPFAHQFALS